jgi:hypothetical protein
MMNGVILPFLTVLTYFSIIWYIGTVARSLKKQKISFDILKNFVCGICIWGIGAVTQSFLGVGTINDLRIYTFFLLSVAIYIGKDKNQRVILDKMEYVFQMKVEKWGGLLPAIIICLIILALCAKTNTAQDYDSLWYGLRSEYVLVGSLSFYDNLGYASFVYYYPKLVELFYLPISGLGDYSFLQCANIGVFVLLLYCINKYIKEFIPNLNTVVRYRLLSVIACIPALANISATAKPDVFGLYLVFAALYFAKLFFRDNGSDSLIYALICLALCTGTKLTYLLWGGILFLWIVVRIIIKRNGFERKKTLLSLRDNLWIIISTIIFLCGIHYRTLKLTGYPIYPLLINLWNKLGFEAKPFLLSTNLTSRQEFSLKNILNRVYEFTIDPNSLSHVVMLWTSNLLWIGLLVFLLYHKKKVNITDVLLAGGYLLATIYYMVVMSEPDGNYFLLPIIAVVLLCIENSSLLDVNKNTVTCGVVGCGTWLVLILTLLPIMFVSHSSWAYGTKAFSTELVADNFDTNSKNKVIMDYYGLSLIYNEVSTYSDTDRVLASGNSSGVCFRLPCSVETYAEMSVPTLANSSNIENYDSFKTYLDTLDVRALIVLNDDMTVFPAYVSKYVDEKGSVNVISDEGAICYVLR